MDNERIFYIYVYLDPRRPGKFVYGIFEFDYEPFYLGKGKDKRLYDHLKTWLQKKDKNKLKVNKIKKIIRVTGENPIIIKYKENLSSKEALYLETIMVPVIGRIDLKTGPLTNMTNGGDGGNGRVVSQEEREWRREFSKTLWNDDRKKAWSASLMGHEVDTVTRGKISKTLTGIIVPEKTKKKISQSLIKKYENSWNPRLGSKQSPATKEIIGQKSKEMWNDPEFRKNIDRKGEKNANSKYIYIVIKDEKMYSDILDLRSFFEFDPEIQVKHIRTQLSVSKNNQTTYKGYIIKRSQRHKTNLI